MIAWRRGPRALAALVTLDAVAGVPRLNDDMVGRIPKAHYDKLNDVGAEEVGGTGRSALAIDGRDALGVGDLLYAAGELRVAPPVRRVHRSAVQRKARVAPEVERLQRSPHAPQPQLSVGEVYLGCADARGAISPKGSEGLVDASIEETPGQDSETGGLSLHLAPTRHRLHPI
jgi:hypothetical protein